MRNRLNGWNMIKNKFVMTALMFIILISAAAYGLVLYNDALKNDLASSIHETLDEVTAQQKFNFNSKFTADVKSIKNFAYMAAPLLDNPALALRTINNIITNSNFEFVIIAGKDGKGLYHHGAVVDVSDRVYFKKVLSGETVINEPVRSKFNYEAIIPIATPIYTDDKISGLLIGTYAVEKLPQLFLPSFGGQGFVYITDHEGNIIVKPQNDNALFTSKYNLTNLHEGFNKVQFLDGYETKEEMFKNISEHKTGYTKISIEGVNEFVHYDFLGVNGWHIFVIVPESYIAARAGAIIRRAVLLAVVIILIFASIIAYIFFMQHKADKEKEAHMAELENIAYYDELTGLSNLNKFKIDAGKVLAENTDTPFVVVKMDILNFKMINEIFGFEIGDKVVCAVGNFIAKVKEAKGLNLGALARINDDEFILLEVSAPGEAGIKEVTIRSQMFEELFNQKIADILGSHRVEFRYGSYFLDIGETDIRGAIEKANISHRLAKLQKNNQICNYDDAFKIRVLREIEIGNSMYAALENKDFKVYLQPKYDINNETIVGAEALVRWQEAGGDIIQPKEFISLFERNGFIIKIDMYMFECVCGIIRGWMDALMPVVTVSVNFSRLHLTNEKFVEQLEEIANRYGVPKNYIEIELTESTMFGNEEVLGKLLNNLHEAGFTLSMDDFGTGYSSLGLLKNLPVDVLKIDRSFFADNTYEERAKIVIESVMSMAKKLQISTVAEGVETKEHIDFLREVGCDIVQGYYYGIPLPADEFHANNTTLDKNRSVL